MIKISNDYYAVDVGGSVKDFCLHHICTSSVDPGIRSNCSCNKRCLNCGTKTLPEITSKFKFITNNLND